MLEVMPPTQKESDTSVRLAPRARETLGTLFKTVYRVTREKKTTTNSIEFNHNLSAPAKGPSPHRCRSKQQLVTARRRPQHVRRLLGLCTHIRVGLTVSQDRQGHIVPCTLCHREAGTGTSPAIINSRLRSCSSANPGTRRLCDTGISCPRQAATKHMWNVLSAWCSASVTR